MLLGGKNAIVYGAAGAVGSAVARVFAREGARLFLTGRRLGAVAALAKDIEGGGGAAAPSGGGARGRRPPGVHRPVDTPIRSRGRRGGARSGPGLTA